MWGGCFSAVDCLFMHYREQDDPWNAIAAGFITGGILQIRSGPQSAFKNACIGGVMLGLIEGVGVMINVYSFRQQQLAMEQQAEMERRTHEVHGEAVQEASGGRERLPS